MTIHPTCQIPNLDRIYEKVFGHRFVGSFVEVGAFDGMTYSNTWGLAVDDWLGLYIEAHPDFAAQCKLVHEPRMNGSLSKAISVESCACGAENGFIDLTIFGECSTAVLNKWNRDWGMNENTPRIKVPMYTLDSILNRRNIERFDLLVIDVEEMEIEVLKGFDLERHHPTMVIIETHEGQGTRPDQKGYKTPWIDSYMKGYSKIYFDQINTIYESQSK